jgi:hypothetical protein
VWSAAFASMLARPLRFPAMRTALAALTLCLAFLGLPAAALAQSAGDEQYVDPFQGGGGGGGGQEQPAEPDPAPEPVPAEPVPAEPVPAEPVPAEPAPAPSVPAEGGNGESAGAAAGTVTTQPAQTTGATLPRTGMPALALLAAGFGLLCAGSVVRRRL